MTTVSQILENLDIDEGLDLSKLEKSLKLTKKNDRDNLAIALKALSKLGLVKYSVNDKISINKESTKDKVMCQITYNNNCKANITSERSKIITKNKSKRKIIINTLDQQKISLDLLNKKIFINEIEQEQKNENTNALVNELIYFYECINNKKTNNISIKSAYSAELISDQIKKKLNEIS